MSTGPCESEAIGRTSGLNLQRADALPGRDCATTLMCSAISDSREVGKVLVDGASPPLSQTPRFVARPERRYGPDSHRPVACHVEQRNRFSRRGSQCSMIRTDRDFGILLGKRFGDTARQVVSEVDDSATITLVLGFLPAIPDVRVKSVERTESTRLQWRAQRVRVEDPYLPLAGFPLSFDCARPVQRPNRRPQPGYHAAAANE